MASEYDRPTNTRVLEPPGFLGLNYGHRTPLTTLLGQIVYGATLGGFAQFSGTVVARTSETGASSIARLSL